MPTMTRFQAAFCRSAPWRGFARRVVLPWALQGFRPEGSVLEVGAGSGAMAVEVLTAFPNVTVTATDYDVAMVDSERGRLAPFGDRATARQADATALPFDDGSFDVVLSWVMLHHTVEWEKALAEAVRVVRPGGHIIGYDLLSTAPLRLVHRGDGERLRLMGLRELREALRELPVEQATLTPSLAGLVVRFTFRKTDGPAL
jgi:ubiquinone/menaquinone biosynthesis C-methylase UbiE